MPSIQKTRYSWEIFGHKSNTEYLYLNQQSKIQRVQFQHHHS